MLNKKDLATIQKQLTHFDEVREEVLSLSRAATRLAGSTILDIHRGDLESAANGIAKVEQTLNHRSYVLGLLDAIGEFRRMALNRLRRGDVKKAEKLLDGMEGIYDDLQTLDHTSIVPTFRVKMDAARRIIESTRGDVVTEVRRFSLEEALNRLDKRLGSRSKN